MKNKQHLLKQLDELISSTVGDANTALQLQRFSQQFFRAFPLLDLQQRGPERCLAGLQRLWATIQVVAPQQSQIIRLENPDGPRSLIMVLSPNIPFILDSIRNELNQRNVDIDVAHHALVKVLRDGQGQLLQIAANGDNGQDLHGDISIAEEAICYLEIAKQSDAQREQLEQAIVDLINAINTVVADFYDMKRAVNHLMDSLDDVLKGVTRAVKDDCKAMLGWLLNNHFTFLGFEHLSVDRSHADPTISKVSGSELGLLKHRNSTGALDLAQDLATSTPQELLDTPLRFEKSSARTNIHRSAYPDYVTVKGFNAQGEVVEEFRFLGLLTSRAYTTVTESIPIIARKVEAILADAGYSDQSPEGKALQRVIEVFPRDELFLAGQEELSATIRGVFDIQERKQVRLFTRLDSNRRFYSCLFYSPKDIYNTSLRKKVEGLLRAELGAEASQFTTFFSESVLTRTHFVLKVDPDRHPEVDYAELERKVVDCCKSWSDRLCELLRSSFPESEAALLGSTWKHAFPPGYQHEFTPADAQFDIARMRHLDESKQLAMDFRDVEGASRDHFRFRLYCYGKTLILSEVIPILEQMGMTVLGEQPFVIEASGQEPIYVHDFSLIYSLGPVQDSAEVRIKFQDGFAAIWEGQADNDAFNRLILGTDLDWRQVSLLRALSRYMKQIAFPFSGRYIATTLGSHLALTQKLMQFFSLRFDPGCQDEHRDEQLAILDEEIRSGLDAVENLNEDRIIRYYVAVIKAIQRTNFYQPDDNGLCKAYCSFKLKPRNIPEVPLPVPLYEIFVYSPRVEGVHLRGGKVARGGLRWSDRQQDYRTEVLGLVKAQQVKNAVIVPVGAKGGFVAKRLPEAKNRAAYQAEGIACYQIFIRGILDLTDNLVAGAVVPPDNVVCHDDADPYLVVAADKGTASFSDIANAISAEYHFWLGDAFASGGSVGYDHKKMGITARGAWVSVERHFRELGVNTSTTDFSVVGIGDMAGDVFGNGMLLSEHICLLGAFNHVHIFIDPSPDPALSFRERKRLFELPGSSWEDYDKSLISRGGGIFQRSAKSIPLSPEMKHVFALSADSLSPSALINAMLKAPVDLIWNGGIGTYIKSSRESHADVGDKANDGLRANASELRCKVIGEGGNLGMTQLARVEFGLRGGASNTDFIDNAAGVDCSDHEVNIKILLQDVVVAGELDAQQREQLLESMTDSVAELVLDNNYAQTQALSVAELQALRRIGEYKRLITRLESSGKLNRALEFIPDDEALFDRRLSGKSLTRPELSVLMAYVKGILKEQLLDSDIPEDEFMSAAVNAAFPPALVQRYPERVRQHRLKREIVVTQVANDMVNCMGITFVERLRQSTGESEVSIAKAYATAREVFSLEHYWSQVEALDYRIDASVQYSLMAEIMRLVRRGSQWLLRNRRSALVPKVEVAAFKAGVNEIDQHLSVLLRGHLKTEWQRRFDQALSQQVPESLARFTAGAASLYAALAIIEVARETAMPVLQVADVYFSLGEDLELAWFNQQIADIKIDNHWQALARESFREDLEWQQRSLTTAVLNFLDEAGDVSAAISAWLEAQAEMVGRWRAVLTEMHGAESPEFAMFSVATRELLDLAQSSKLRQ